MCIVAFLKGLIQGKILHISNKVSMHTLKKRFIAGATCPKCGALDTMALTKEDNVEKVTCVACGDQMTQPEEHVEKDVRPSEQVIGVFKP